jgi:hypothetical protein
MMVAIYSLKMALALTASLGVTRRETDLFVQKSTNRHPVTVIGDLQAQRLCGVEMRRVRLLHIRRC